MKRTLTVLIASLPLLGTGWLAAAAEQGGKPYPLETCVVSGEKLGEMGDPHVFTHEGQQIKLCCKGCLKKFNQDPDRYLKRLDKHGDSHAHGGHEGQEH